MIYAARPDGTVIGKFSEAEFRTIISSGEVWGECLYLEESEQVWHKASEYPSAVVSTANNARAERQKAKP